MSYHFHFHKVLYRLCLKDIQKIICRGGGKERKRKITNFYSIHWSNIQLFPLLTNPESISLYFYEDFLKMHLCPWMKCSFSPSAPVQLIWFSSKIMQLNKIQKSASQLSFRFFRIPKTYFKSLLNFKENTI